MRTATIAIVGAGLAVALLLGYTRGFDAAAVTILVLIALVGALAIAAAARTEQGDVEPARCRACGGVVSPHAPFCKHCGARSQSGARPS